jgi:hypothetical protein
MFLWCPSRATTRVPSISKRNRGKSREDSGDTDNGKANKVASSTTTRRSSSNIESICHTVGRKGPPILRTHEKADKAFAHLKRVLSTPPVLVAPNEKEPLLLYIAAMHQVISTVLVVERSEEGKAHGVRRPVYFLSKVLSPSKQCYRIIKNSHKACSRQLENCSTISWSIQ